MAAATTTTTTTGEITLKLLIDSNTEKVVFAEAKKDFVDYLFGLLQVPVGSILGNLLANKMDGAGSISRVYKSVMDLESSYLLTDVSRDLLLCPKMSSSSTSITIPPLLQSFEISNKKSENETRRDSNANVTLFGATPSAPSLFGSSFSSTNTEAIVASPSKPEGFVSGMTQYMVMDDLTVKLSSPISSVTLLNTIGVKDFSCFVEKIVTINFNKGLELVKASFVSDTVLSDVFVRNHPRRTNVFDPFSVDVWDPFDGFFNVPSNSGRSEASAFANTRIDWKETPEAHVFKADLPGIKKQEVKVEVEEGRILQISGERSKEQEDKNDKWHRVERSSGKFLRRFRLPENVNMDQVKATMENGVLTVTVPKEEEEKKPQVKSIDISG
ncbi:hypothetical protein EZV62_002632 [Acer yangbiense]|uniref:Uncharacterized protein n=1 Tax=Acer yangbiense TaxID=1000413 RepID=A0A5C7IXY8_9ROSI|nr:hypothetical protein EZV62_002632 [Acer yangbiense]